MARTWAMPAPQTPRQLVAWTRTALLGIVLSVLWVDWTLNAGLEGTVA